MKQIYLVLLHYPVMNKFGQAIMSSVTNLDIHDISRLAACYDLKAFYIVSPDPLQQNLVTRVRSFWEKPEAIEYNPHRASALKRLRISDSLETVKDEITSQEGMQPLVVTTTAREMPDQISFRRLKALSGTDQPIVLVFGTGHGLCPEIHLSADCILEPIKGTGAYNHLSVRSAVAIILDRISSEKIDGRNNGYSANYWQRPAQNRLPRLSRWRYGKSPL